MGRMVNVTTSGDSGAFGQALADRLKKETFEGDFSVRIRKPQNSRDGTLVKSGAFPPDTDATLVHLDKPITAEATLKLVRIISDEFCNWTLNKEQGEHVSKKRRALIIREGEAERTLRTILFDDVGS
ncbi:MAG: hypothetical protein WB992_13170 [Bryobacteraceae bacterium]